MSEDVGTLQGCRRVESASEPIHSCSLGEGKGEVGGGSSAPVNPHLEPCPWETETFTVALVIIIKTGNNPQIYLYENDRYSVTFLHEMPCNHSDRATRSICKDAKVSEGRALCTAVSRVLQAVAGEGAGSKDCGARTQVLVMNSKEKFETI